MKTKPMYKYLLLLTVCSAVGLQGWRTLFNNFAVDTIGLDGSHIGVIQSVREIPGFLALCAVFFLYLLREHVLSAVSIIIFGVGIAFTGMFPTYGGLIMTTLLMSFGFHYYETTNQSLTLQYFDEHETPMVIGIQRSVSAVTNIVVGCLIFVAARYVSYEHMYLCIGIPIVVVGAWALTHRPADSRGELQHKKMIVRKRYMLFYVLTFLAGARRQIFVVFSVFLLVKRFNMTVQEITVLFIVNNLINYFICPLIGKAVVRFGERRILSVEYASLIVIFMVYALSQSKWLVAVMYVCDHIVFNFAMAIRTYFQKHADPRDVAPSMAVGFTINHIAAVVLPVAGGLLWMIDYRIPFFVGAGLSVVSLCAVQWMRQPVPGEG